MAKHKRTAEGQERERRRKAGSKERQRLAARRTRKYHEAIERLGGVCAHCGEVEDLEFDHIDPRTKTAPVMRLWSYSARFEAELAKCQLLCWECHQLKTECQRHARFGTTPLILQTIGEIPF